MDTELSMLLRGRPSFSAWGEPLGGGVRNFFMTMAINILARQHRRPLQILEVGSWLGASVATWSEALTRFHPPGGQITCVDPWALYDVENEVHEAETVDRYRHALQSNYAFRLFSYNAGLLPHKVVPMRGLSTEVLPLLRDTAFDLVYIDGDHAYEACRFDIEQGRRLVAPGGILCGDDLDMTLAEVDRAFVEANRNKQPAKDPATGRSFHPGVTLAVAEAMPEAANYLGFWCARREGAGFVPLQTGGAAGFLPDMFEPAFRARATRLLQDLGFTGGAAQG